MALYVGCFIPVKIVKEFPSTLPPTYKLKESTAKTHWLPNEFGNGMQKNYTNTCI